MRVGAYIDGYNLYYAGRAQCGRGVAGWRWLDLRALVATVIAKQPDWPGTGIERIVYCTARIDARDNPSGHGDQDVYLKALLAARSVDQIEYGEYVNRVRFAPLARRDRKGRPVLVQPEWPIKVQCGGTPPPTATFMASVAVREEKGSDVNVATRMLIDILTGKVDAALVISNDSDLALPVSEARKLVPVGMVNPSNNYPAGALNGNPAEGVGRHWWRQLQPADFTAHQLPSPVGRYRAPAGW